MQVPKRKALLISADFAPRIGCHGNTNRETNTRLNINTNMSTTPENLVKIGLVASEISLLQATVKKGKSNRSKT